ncbi:MAG: hypothetical protein NZ903_02045 [Candidatus Micrarchaeota archaeon]|nr:hypothetical protein [Candidatus Micrarchaeota archaeon]
MYFDIVDFPIEESEHKPFYKVYRLSDIKKHIVMGDPEFIIKNMRKGRILYCPKYEISLEMFAKARSLDKPFLISISDIIAGKAHVQIYRISNFIRVGRHYKIKFILSSMAKDKYMLRSPDEAAAIMRLCGMSKEQVKHSFTLLPDYLNL